MAAIQKSCSDCNNLINTDKVEDGVILNGTIEKNKLDAAFNGTKNVPKKEEKPSKCENLLNNFLS